MTVSTLISVLQKIAEPDVEVYLECDDEVSPCVGVRVAYNEDGEPAVTIL